MATKKITDLTQLTDLDATDSFVVNDSGAGADKRVEFSDLQSEVLNGAAIGTSTAITELQVDNLNLNGNTISSTDTNGNVTIDPNGTGSTVLVGDLLVDDKIIHSGDTNTAIRFPSADTVTVETAGSERMRIDSSGNVGIGVTPSEKLHIAKSVAGDMGPVLYLHNNIDSSLTGHSASIRFNLRESENTSRNAIIGAVANSSFGADPSIYFSTSEGSNGEPTERMRITSSGNVGIGVTPSGSKLDIVQTTGDASLRLTSTSASTSGTGAVLALVCNDGAAISSGDRISTVIFQGSADSSNTIRSGARISAFADGNYSTTSAPTRMVFETTPSGSSATTERMRITSDGYLRMSSVSGGIQFGGDTAAANALDDYDTGTYTATLTCGTSGTITLNSSFDQLSYTKIGRLMTITGRISVSSVSSPVGNIQLNLPTAIANLTDTAGNNGGMFPVFGTSANVNDFFWFGAEGDSYVIIRKGGSTNGTNDSAETFSGDESMNVSFSYISA